MADQREDSVRIAHGIFSEFIRNEEGGKATAIGLFGRKIIFPYGGMIYLPNLGFHCHILNPNKYEMNGTVKLRLPDGSAPPEQPVHLPACDFEANNINMNYANIFLQKPGRIIVTVEIKTLEGDLSDSFTLDVAMLPDPSQPTA